jgi:hypothetical protein
MGQSQYLFHPGHDHEIWSKLDTIMRPGQHDHGQDGARNMITARMWQYLFHTGHDHEKGSKLAAIMTSDRQERHDRGQDGPRGQHDHDRSGG